LDQSQAQQVLSVIQNAGNAANTQIQPKVESIVKQAIEDDVQAAANEGDGLDGDSK